MTIELARDGNTYSIKFKIPHEFQGEKKDGLAMSFSFPEELLQEHHVAEPEELPSWIWIRKLYAGFLSLQFLIEEYKLHEGPQKVNA